MLGKILYVGHSPTITTGQGIVGRRLCDGLQQAGFDVVALAMGEDRRRPPTLPYRLWIPCTHDTMGWGLLPQLLSTEQPSVALVHGDLEATSEATTHVRRINPHLPVALYYSVEGEPFHPGWGATVRSADVAMVYTEYGKVVTKRSTGRDVPVIPLGIDPTDFSPLSRDERDAWRRELGWEGRFVVCYVARNMWTKQQPVLLHALQSLLRGGLRDLLLYLHCKPFERHRHGGWDLASMVKQMGLENVVAFPDRELPVRASDEGRNGPGMREIYSCCDLYVHPSSVEGFGFPLLEAMACGRVVVHTADGGVMDEVCGEAGERVAPATWVVSSLGSRVHVLDSDVLAATMLRLYRESVGAPQDWRRREEASLKRASQFPWERSVSDVVGLVKTLRPSDAR